MSGCLSAHRRARDSGEEVTEGKCHPEKRLCLIAPGLISGWCSQERLIWHLCRYTQISSAFKLESFRDPIRCCFLRRGFRVTLIIDMINDKRRSGPRDDNGSCLRCESDLQNASQDVQKFAPAVFINPNHRERKKKKMILEFVLRNLFILLTARRWARATLFLLTLKCVFAFPLVFCMSPRSKRVMGLNCRRGSLKKDDAILLKDTHILYIWLYKEPTVYC